MRGKFTNLGLFAFASLQRYRAFLNPNTFQSPKAASSWLDFTMEERSYLPVTVDKSHLVTIGERLYAESIELIRELVNNAYDADATEVKVPSPRNPCQWRTMAPGWIWKDSNSTS